MKKLETLVLILLFILSHFTKTAAQVSSYDPLKISEQNKPEVIDLTVNDAGRNREIPIRIYLPLENKSAPIVLFSHGLGGSREGSAYLGKHWSARGFVSVFLQHPGSDESVWKNVPATQRMKNMKQAASIQNFLLRVKDVQVVLDQLTEWNETENHQLKGRLDLNKIGMSGHSFGAVTTQAVSGQSTGRSRISFTDRRISAAAIFSPSSPKNISAKEAFGNVKIPWMLMTGTKDLAVIGDADLESRLGVFPALPAGNMYELVLFNAEHSAFSDRALPGDKEKRNPNHHRAIIALSTAFWDAFLRNDKSAKEWLASESVYKILEKDDRWQKK